MSCSLCANKDDLNLKAGEERKGGQRCCIHTILPYFAHAQKHTQGSVYRTKQEESDSEGECIIVDKDKVFHEQGDKVHIKLAIALSIAALQQKWMPCISERFNYTHIISFNS